MAGVCEDTSCPGTPGCAGAVRPRSAASPWRSVSAPSPFPAAAPGPPQTPGGTPGGRIRGRGAECANRKPLSSLLLAHADRGCGPVELSNLFLSRFPPLQFGLQPQLVVTVVPADPGGGLPPGLDGRPHLPLLLSLLQTALLEDARSSGKGGLMREIILYFQK